MTGFARSAQTSALGMLVWELRTVNHRYLEVSLRLPDDFKPLESELRHVISSSVRRGKLDATLQFKAAPDGAATLSLDTTTLDALILRAQEVSRRATAHGGTLASPTALDLLRWPGVIKDPEIDRTPLLDTARQTLQSALNELMTSRLSEGQRIEAMLASRCQQLATLVAGVRARLPEVRQKIKARLEERLGQLVLAAEPNRERFEQELSLALSKMDVDEELDRLASHITECGKALSGDEPAGRKLDFLMQEFNREANTLSSKSQDSETTRAALEMKVLIEQMREQVQNIE